MHFRARVGDGDEAAAGFVGANSLLHALEEILLIDVGFERAAGFAGNDEEGLGEIDFLFDGADLCRVGGIENVQAREARSLREGELRAPRAKAGTAHAEQKDVGEASGFDFSGEHRELRGVGNLIVGNAKPAQPFGLVIVGPEAGVELPEAPYFSAGTPVIKVFFYRTIQISGKGSGLRIDLRRGGALGIFFDRGEQGVKGIGEKFDAVGGQFVGHIFHDDANAREVGHGFARVVHAFGKGLAWFAMIAEGIERCGRNGVDRVGPDEFINIKDVAVVRILGAGAGPEHALRLRVFGGEGLPARSGKDPLVGFVLLPGR